MAREIKAITCPHCGSIDKTEVKPDFYRCLSCSTEYYLDNDDTHIYYHYQQTTPASAPSPAVGKKAPVYALIFAIFFIVAIYFIATLTQRHSQANTTASVYKMPRSFFATYLYTNAATGDPVYLRLGTDQVDKGNNQYGTEVHAQYNDAVNGNLIADRVMFENRNHKNAPYLEFRAFADHLIYALADNVKVYQLDTRNNTLTEITDALFKDFPRLSSGVAKIAFENDKGALNILTNEGNTFYYFPITKQLVDNAEQLYSLSRAQASKHYFEFANPGDVTDASGKQELHEVKYLPSQERIYRNFTPKRFYYHPQILLQDGSNLIIATNSTPSDNSSLSLQSIDINTGAVQWTYTPGKYLFYTTCKCKQGIAVEYRTDEELDYVHGVFVISPAGKLVHNYELKRTE